MKIYNIKKFMLRIFISLIALTNIIVPFVWSQYPFQDMIDDCGDGLQARILMFAVVLCFEFMGCIVLIGAYYGIKWLCKINICKKWVYWICAEEDADKFIGNI